MLMMTRKILSVIFGVMMIIAGAYCFFTPVESSAVIPLVLGIVMMGDGIGRIVTWFDIRDMVRQSAWVLASAVVTCAVSCNQTLATMLTHQLCEDVEPDDRTMMIDLEDTVIVVSALIPWSIAATVPLASVGAPTASILAACFLYLMPLWTVLSSTVRRRRGASQEGR